MSQQQASCIRQKTTESQLARRMRRTYATSGCEVVSNNLLRSSVHVRETHRCASQWHWMHVTDKFRSNSGSVQISLWTVLRIPDFSHARSSLLSTLAAIAQLASAASGLVPFVDVGYATTLPTAQSCLISCNKVFVARASRCVEHLCS